jgi:hypothetical protein
MKSIVKLIAFLFISSGFFISCEKAEPLKTYPDGVPAQLTLTPTGQTATFADSNIVVLNLSWTDPQHAQEKSLYKYYVEIDSSTDFKTSHIINVNNDGNRSTQMKGYQINQILVGYGYGDPTKTYDLYFRVASSYGNNNESLKSSPVKIRVSPYVLPLVKTPVNNEIWLVGGASDGGWNNPLRMPYLVDQKFTKVSATKYELSIFLYASEGYLILPVMSSWGTKYCLPEGVSVGGTTNGGDFVFRNNGGQDFLSPSDEGTYKLTFDFMTGKFTVAPAP